VGRDVSSFANALKAALREDLDVLFIGEIRDLPSLEVALQAAETGHLVFSTFHTSTALKTIQRLVSLYPSDDQLTARARLADTLRGIICQRLVPRRGQRGRVLCAEALVNNYAIKEAIRDSARTPTIPAIMERSGDQQMQLFDQALATLVREQVIAPDVAIRYANSPADLRRTLSFAE
jgi:twitching motility protein PilT